MHWFDRMAEKVAAAPEARATRRRVLGGALAGGALVALPLSPDALAFARNKVRGELASAECVACFADAKNHYVSNTVKCDILGDGQSPVLSARVAGELPRGKPKKPKKPKHSEDSPGFPWTGPAQTACEAWARALFIDAARTCRTGKCAQPAPPPIVQPDPGNPGGGMLVCPSGTTKCGGEACCYGGDACCGCPAAGGVICCAAVIGCTCC